MTVICLWYVTEPYDKTIGILDRLLVALYYLFVLVIIVKHWKKLLYFLTKDKILLLFLLLPLASVLWSTMPEVSQSRFIRVVLRSTIFGLYLASRYSLKDLMRLITIALGVSLIINTAAALALPTGKTDGAWKGVLGHKNSFGRLMAWTTAHFATLFLYEQKYRRLCLIVFGLAAVGLYFSQAKSSLAICVGALALLPLYRSFCQAYRTKTLLISVSLFIAILLISWVSDNVEYIIVDVLGKSLTLNGRVQIWEYFYSRIATRPWLGFGYEAFWNNPEELLKAQQNLPWFSGHAHSGFIDLTLQLGILGFSMFVISVLVTITRVIYLTTVTRSIEHFLMLLFLVVWFSSQSTVGISILKDNIFWILYVTISTLTAVEMSRVRRNQRIESSQVLTPAS
ncbi:MAG: O-antigen ligase family protein [Cyanobacteria bacterium CRU_2_1]|nr:O-antigen ligase family protein [Cyanobacteria bacterium CRU_2_1]